MYHPLNWQFPDILARINQVISKQIYNAENRKYKILGLSVGTGSINYRVLNIMHLIKRMISSFGTGKISKICY